MTINTKDMLETARRLINPDRNTIARAEMLLREAALELDQRYAPPAQSIVRAMTEELARKQRQLEAALAEVERLKRTQLRPGHEPGCPAQLDDEAVCCCGQ